MTGDGGGGEGWRCRRGGWRRVALLLFLFGRFGWGVVYLFYFGELTGVFIVWKEESWERWEGGKGEKCELGADFFLEGDWEEGGWERRVR